MIFGASLYPCIIHHHNPKSPSKNWGTFVLQPSLFLSKSSNKMFATTTKNCTDFPAKVKQEKKQKYHRHQPKNKMRSSSFFSKKKRNIIGNTRLKKQSVGTCFHVSTWIFPVLFCCGRSYSPLSSFGRFMPYHPSRGPQPGGIMSNKVRVVSTKASFFDGFLKFHPPNKKTGSKVDPFLVGFFCCHGFFVIRFWFVDVFWCWDG